MTQSTKPRNHDCCRYGDACTHNAAGAVTLMQIGNGKSESTQFNSRLQPTQIALGTTQGGTGLLDLDYTYGTTNNNGNVLSQIITVPTVGSNPGFVATQTYSYDSLNRISQATETIPNQTGWNQTFSYDRYGNRNFVEAPTTTLLKQCNNNTEVCPADRPKVNPSIDLAKNRLIGYVFDNAGNTAADADGQTFTYDAENKQVQVNNAQGIVGQYFYDGDGNRVKKYVPSTGETTIFVYDAAGKLVAEYSTIVEPTTTAKVSYLTNDHLGSPRITTDAIGQTISRRDFMPFGEEIARANYGADSVRQKFTGYERDIESNLDFAEARMHNFQHGRFTSPDDFRNDTDGNYPQSWNLYIYVRNKPLVFIDPTGKMGDYYTEHGQWVGSDGIKDDKVHVAKVNSTHVDNKGVRHWNVTIEKTLSIGHKEFQARAATAYGESSANKSSVSMNDLAHEMAGIAYVNTRNGEAYGADNPQAQAFMNTTPEGRTGKMQLANFAIINEQTGGADPSNGATMWDGAEQALFPASDTRASTGKWELHMNTMGWNISNQDYATWKANVGSGFKAPQVRVSPQNYPKKGYYNKGKTRLHSTAVYGRTIFWRVVP